MGCAIEVVKIILFIFNLIFTLCGIGLIAIGVIYIYQLEDYTKYMDDHISVAPTFIIGVGAIIFIIAFFGCCGAIRENHCMVTTYATLLLTIFIIEVAIGVYIYMRSDGKHIDTTMKDEYNRVFKNYHKDPAAMKSIDAVQKQLQCCGVDGPTDYVVNFADIVVPGSCCKDPTATSCTIGLSQYWTDGCVEKMDRFKDSAAQILGITAIAIAVIEVVGIIFALCLANSIKNHDRRMNV